MVPIAAEVWKVEWNDKEDWDHDITCLSEDVANNFADYLKATGNINIRIVPTIALQAMKDPEGKKCKD